MIEGVRGRQPVGVILTCGIKGPRGFPTGTDRYYFVNVKEENGVRALHPAFQLFNDAEPERRKVIRGVLVHGDEEDAYSSNLRAQVLPLNDGKPVAHPNKRPVCSGDGKTASRWMGGDPGNFRDIECPNELCPFRQKIQVKGSDELKPAPCKPSTHLLFMLRWPDATRKNPDTGKVEIVPNPLPRMLCRFDTGAWNTTDNLQGFFNYLRASARELGLSKYTLFGYPFTLTLTKQTKPSETSKFPVTVITPEVEPAEFFYRQREQLRAIGAEVPFVAITDRTVTEAIDHDSAAGRGSLNVPGGGAK